MYYFVNTPKFIQSVFSSLTWKIPSKERIVYLTFDDGPTKEVTSSLLDILNKEKVKATFFCVGKNVEKHTDLFQEIKLQGHGVGNHSNTHINGWRTNKKQYLEDIDAADKLINSGLFRPPYGKLNWRSKKALQKKYKIIMWDVAGGDFDKRLSVQQVIENVTHNVKPGSIVVLHDNQKFKETILSALPVIIKELKAAHYNFGVLA